MAIIQISKIQQRSGNLVDLPQLDEAEFGFASDDKRLFIGKESPNENIEVLTSYSEISFSQLQGSVGNLNINALSIADGQVLTYDGNNWVNRGGNAGGLITLGNVSNVKIDGGAIGYVLETDGTGNLSWTPKSTIIAYIVNVTQANPAVVTTTEDNFFTNGAEITITGAIGMTELNGNSYYVDVLTANTFALYSNPSLSSPINSTGYGQYAYANVTGSTSSTNTILLDDETPFSVNDPVVFIGNTGNSGITPNVTYYVDTVVASTGIKISETLGGNIFAVATDTFTSEVYVSGGRAISLVSGGSGAAPAAGATYSVQYNNATLMGGSSDLTWNFDASPKVLTVNGNANVGNLNSTTAVTASYFISNASTGTQPITVNSTTRVANLNVSYSNVADFSNVLNTTTNALFYPTFVSSSSNGNSQLRTSSNFVMNPANSYFAATTITANTFIGNGSLLTGITTFGIANGTSNISIPLINGNINTTVNGVANVFVVTSTGINVSGTLNATGNANAGNIGATNGVFTNISGTLTTASQNNITSVGTLGNLTVTSNVTAGNLLGVANANITKLNVSGQSNLNSVSNIYISGGTPNQVLSTNGSGNLSWIDPPANSQPAGSNTQVQFNDAGVLAGSSGLVYNKTTGRLTATSYAGSGANLTNLNGANVTGAVAFATTANAVAGSNVSGFVSNAVYANTAGALSASISNVTITGGTNGYVLSTDGLGNLSWIVQANGGNGGGTPGGSNTQIQYNSSGVFAGSPSFTINQSTGVMTVANLTATGNIVSANANLGNAARANFFIGQIVTANQPNITALGTLTGLSISGYSDLGSVSNITIYGGSPGQFLQTNGLGGLSWATGAGGGGTPGGSNTQLQFNDGGTFGGNTNLTYNKSSSLLSLVGTLSVNGNANVGNIGAIYGVFTTVSGTLTTANQSNITTVGTLGNLVVAGNANVNILRANSIIGPITTASQTNITALGTLTGLTVNGATNLGPVSNVTITGGTNGQFLQTNGSGGLSWANASAIAPVGGSNTQVQFNDGGNFGGNSNFTYNKITGNANVGNIGAASGVFTNITGTITTASASQTNITAVGTLTSLTVSPGNTNVGTLNVSGGVYNGGSSIIIAPSGNITFNRNTVEKLLVRATGIDVTGTANVSGATNVGTSLSVGGAASIGGNLAVTGTGSIGGNLTVGGNVLATYNVVAYNTSDARLKENIVPIENALDKIKKISGVMFDWKDGHEIDRKHDTGLIAQEVEEVLPEVVTTRPSGYKAVRYEKIMGLVVQAIKELSDQVDEIKKKL